MFFDIVLKYFIKFIKAVFVMDSIRRSSCGSIFKVVDDWFGVLFMNNNVFMSLNKVWLVKWLVILMSFSDVLSFYIELIRASTVF